MLNLLIVDDESYTREGIFEMIPWTELGITEVRQAFDGINALEVMKEYTPNILLTDIKMPRMNGIDLAIKVRELYPHCSIIFMSSYSDKIYLKSAIQLKAINYVEKPLDIDELYNSIRNASLETLKLKTINENIENNVVIQLSNESQSDTLDNLLINCYPKDFIIKLKSCFFINVVITFFSNCLDNKQIIIDSIKNLVSLYDCDCLITFKDDSELILHIFSDEEDLIMSSDNINLLLIRVSTYLNNFSNHYICVGLPVNNISLLSHSYKSAREQLNYIFYYDYNSIIFATRENISKDSITNIVYSEFESILKRKDKNSIFSYTQKLLKELKSPYANTPSFVKNVYYNLTIRIINFSKSRNINIEVSHTADNILNDILSFNNIYELDKYLWDKINILFKSTDLNPSSTEPIQEVVKFINDNYDNPNLSLDEISKNTYLTSSYICVIFKDYTGTTVNKYINELRLNKAKELLQNPEIKMKDIANKTGYSDGNYFAKIFKKETGYNPSDYRRVFAK